MNAHIIAVLAASAAIAGVSAVLVFYTWRTLEQRQFDSELEMALIDIQEEFERKQRGEC